MTDTHGLVFYILSACMMLVAFRDPILSAIKRIKAGKRRRPNTTSGTVTWVTGETYVVTIVRRTVSECRHVTRRTRNGCGAEPDSGEPMRERENENQD